MSISLHQITKFLKEDLKILDFKVSTGSIILTQKKGSESFSSFLFYFSAFSGTATLTNRSNMSETYYDTIEQLKETTKFLLELNLITA